ncbi:MAG: hypothetical protein JWM63_1002 [Gammaproteobacteria bacterium]|nr:hypothetical protein [Gammaproteobacteria bacterium]
MDLSTLLSTLNLGTETGAPATSQIETNVSRQRLDPANPPAIGGSADVYHGSGAPASASLLAQSGIGAYVQLLNVLTTRQLYENFAERLTNSLGNTSAALKSGYYAAVSRLSAQLQQKDWGFTVSSGNLVFTPGKDELSAQDLADLQKAFAASNVESAARQVATAIASIGLRQKAAADAGSLAWGRLEVDETNFGDVVDLRAYVTASPPGGKYNPNATEPDHTRIPLMLGGMDLRDLACARPDFFRANGSVKTDTLDGFDAPLKAEDVGTLHGQCSCGEVRFTVEDAFDYAFYCHCSRCRLRTGSAFAAIAGISIDKIQVTAGREHLLIEGECSEGYGARCGRCYAFIFAAVRGRQYMHVSLGALVGTPSRVPDHHIYVGSKAPWYRIADALPQYNELP